jgi:hypothetical protein
VVGALSGDDDDDDNDNNTYTLLGDNNLYFIKTSKFHVQ